MKKWILAAILGLTVTIGLQACAPKSQDDCGYVQNVYGERISWKGELPITLHLHESFPDEHIGAVKNAAKTWNDAAGKTVFVIADGKVGGANAPARDRQNIIYYSSTWDADKMSEQAKTSVHWVGDLIQEADIRVNAAKVQTANGYNSYFQFYWSQAGTTGVNIEALVLHEMGHVLGMKHKDGQGSVMATYLASNSDRTQLAETDQRSLQCEY